MEEEVGASRHQVTLDPDKDTTPARLGSTSPCLPEVPEPGNKSVLAEVIDLLARRAPNWPRYLRRPLAATYCGVSPSKFDAQVKEGTYPKPRRVGKTPLWDRKKLDREIDKFEGFTDVPEDELRRELDEWQP